MIVHQFVVIAGAVPTSYGIDVLTVRQFCIVQMTCLMPTRHVKAASLNIKEINRPLRRVTQNNIGPNLKYRRRRAYTASVPGTPQAGRLRGPRAHSSGLSGKFRDCSKPTLLAKG